MTFNNFIFYGVASLIFWIASGITFHISKKDNKNLIANILTILGTLTLITFFISLWIHLKRPPFRTMGETRLLYAIMISSIGIILANTTKKYWLRTYSIFMASIFIILNIVKPELFDKTLMPALQSPWFIPHVIAYIQAYALLGAASLIAGKSLIQKNFDTNIELADSIVYLGYFFLTIGLLLGALWAKIAWGTYWAWDPKETWALLTWLSYIIYIHLRVHLNDKKKLATIFLIANFAILLLCWFGVNYLPSANQSIHVYSKS